jgi:hypothetical protein
MWTLSNCAAAAEIRVERGGLFASLGFVFVAAAAVIGVDGSVNEDLALDFGVDGTLPLPIVFCLVLWSLFVAPRAVFPRGLTGVPGLEASSTYAFPHGRALPFSSRTCRLKPLRTDFNSFG